MKPLVIGLLAWILAGLSVLSVRAQDEPVPPPAPVVDRTPEELDQLVAPIALYPDPLIAQIMAAATFPDQIVLADRYTIQGMSADDVAQQNLDPSVQGLAHYPTLLKWLDDNLEWTTQLGQAFAANQNDVMDAVQRMRAKAQSLGNLQSTPQQNVVVDNGAIEIEPASPEVIYVPEYDPVVIYTTPRVYCTFVIGLPVGWWCRHDWDWRRHHIIFWTANHPRPHNWWIRPPSERHDHGGAHVWHPIEHRPPIVADRGYARPVQLPRRPVAPQPFRSAPGGRGSVAIGGAAAPHSPKIIRQIGPSRPEQLPGRPAELPPSRPFQPPATAVIPPTHAVVPPSRAVIPPSQAVVPHSGAVVPPTRPVVPPNRAVEPPRTPVIAPRPVDTAPRLSPPVQHVSPAPARPAPSAGSLFGSGESSRQTQQFSVRGAESRGFPAPSHSAPPSFGASPRPTTPSPAQSAPSPSHGGFIKR